jgi:GDP-D-mannose dehydratase
MFLCLSLYLHYNRDHGHITTQIGQYMANVTFCYHSVIILGNLYIVRKCYYDTTYSPSLWITYPQSAYLSRLTNHG